MVGMELSWGPPDPSVTGKTQPEPWPVPQLSLHVEALANCSLCQVRTSRQQAHMLLCHAHGHMHAAGNPPLGDTQSHPKASPAPGRAQGTQAHAGMALAHLSEHLNLPALYDGAIQLLPCPVGICASFKSYKPKTL